MGEWAGRCYEQGVMNELYRTKYKNDIHVDNSRRFIYNDCYNSYVNDLKRFTPFIIHLCGIDNSIRSSVFKNFV